MSRFDKVLQRVLRGTSDTNIPFVDLCYLLEKFGFEERVKGSHHIFTLNDVREIINLQPKGNLVKIYQVKQVRGIILKYKLEA
ncbi:MAG: type II toxin-antitoxin system HicA family toxin [Spirochaetales bacterium]|nr:type II toxin-antitoxin system HicA family toxin [Spirochaetales bacterium]